MLSRFYGFTYKEILEMPFSVFIDYQKAIKIINARERLDDIRTSNFSKNSAENRKKIWKSYSKDAENEDKKAMSQEEIARKLMQWQMKK